MTLTPSRPPFSAYFNRGITATQALTHALNEHPSIQALAPHILDPTDPIRIRLMGQLQEGVTSLLARADKDGGIIHAALYELNDPDGLEKQLQANPHSRNVVLGNEQGKDDDDADAENRKNLKAAGVNVIDRILGKGDIPHNKFLVLTENNTPTAVLSGSTNWTSTGLCTQTNNALIIESKDVARRYLDYWNALKADCDAAQGSKSALQSKTLRDFDHNNNESSIREPISLGDGVTIEVMFSPNTPHKLSKNPDTPDDMGRVFELMDGAKQAILFLAFDPGNNSILNEAGKMLAKNPDLFVRGALTSAQRATQFSDSLHAGGASDAAVGDEDEHGKVTVVGESGKPKEKGAPTKGIDFRAVPAGAVTDHDAFGKWEAELQKYGFAIIHNKIVVIDPFSDNCTVVTGSHNLGFRASHNNDENMVIVRGHRGLAEAYACHVLDIYDHYAWRYLLKQHPDIFGQPLEADDKWQERYIQGADVKSPELRFWLAAAGHAVASASPKPPAKPAQKPAAAAPKAPAKSDDADDAAPAKPARAAKKAPKKTAKKASAIRAKKTAKGAGKEAAKTKKAAKKTSKKAAKKTAKKSARKASKAKKAPKKGGKKKR